MSPEFMSRSMAGGLDAGGAAGMVPVGATSGSIQKGTETVAEKASKKAGEKTRRRPSPAAGNSGRVAAVPKAGPTQSQTFVMRLDPEFKEWLNRFANYCRLNMVDVIDLALADYAKARGFDGPPRRI